VAGTLMAQPDFLELQKYPVRSGTYASCQKRTAQPGFQHDPEKCEAVFRKDHAQTKT